MLAAPEMWRNDAVFFHRRMAVPRSHKRNLYRAAVSDVCLALSVVLRSRTGHVTRRKAAIGAKNSVKRNHVHADLFRVRAYPPARIATVNQSPPTVDNSHVMRSS